MSLMDCTLRSIGMCYRTYIYSKTDDFDIIFLDAQNENYNYYPIIKTMMGFDENTFETTIYLSSANGLN